MCAASKLKSCGSSEQPESSDHSQESNSNQQSSPSNFENEPDSREKCIFEKCSCKGPLHKLSRSEKKACKMCARKNGCFRQKSRNQALAELKKSKKEEENKENKEVEVESEVESGVYKPDEGISQMDSSEAAAIPGFAAQPGNPRRILPQQSQQTYENEQQEADAIRMTIQNVSQEESENHNNDRLNYEPHDEPSVPINNVVPQENNEAQDTGEENESTNPHINSNRGTTSPEHIRDPSCGINETNMRLVDSFSSPVSSASLFSCGTTLFIGTDGSS
jgi:hypothetical protein